MLTKEARLAGVKLLAKSMFHNAATKASLTRAAKATSLSSGEKALMHMHGMAKGVRKAKNIGVRVAKDPSVLGKAVGKQVGEGVTETGRLGKEFIKNPLKTTGRTYKNQGKLWGTLAPVLAAGSAVDAVQNRAPGVGKAQAIAGSLGTDIGSMVGFFGRKKMKFLPRMIAGMGLGGVGGAAGGALGKGMDSVGNSAAKRTVRDV